MKRKKCQTDQRDRQYGFKKKWRVSAVSLAALMLFTTISSVALSAATMETEQTDSMEIGAETRRELICSPKDLNHQHVDTCKDKNGAYICGYEDFAVHLHNEDCYNQAGELCCLFPEIKPHTHTENCYSSDKLVCGMEEILPHEHNEDCYDGSGMLICGKTQVLEHIHSEECFHRVLDIQKTDDTENGNDQQDADLIENNGQQNADSLQDGDNQQNSDNFQSDKKEQNAYNTQNGENLQNTDSTLITEDSQDSMEEKDIPAAVAESEENQENEQSTEELKTQLDENIQPTIVTLDDSFRYEDENISVDLEISGDATVVTETNEAGTETNLHEQRSPAENESTEIISETTEDLMISVDELTEGQPEYDAVEAYALEQGVRESTVGISVLDFSFYYQSFLLDVTGCTLNAEIRPAESVQTAAVQMDNAAGESAPEAEIGIELTALQNKNGQIEVVDNVLVEKDGDNVPVIAVALNSMEPEIQVLASETANPKFQVQYYAWLPIVQYGENGQLQIINTDNGGDGTGGDLPENGETGVTKTMNLELTDVGNGKSKVTTENELREVYAGQGYEYIKAPNLTYFNRLYENGNYILSQVWILKSGKQAESTNQDDWTVYNASDIHFTNRKESVNEDTVLITDDMVIRLVFETTSNTYNNAAAFYDYDITEDGNCTYKNGQDQGINNPNNYTDYTEGDAKFAFGNANTGVSLKDQQWNGNQLNQYNRSGKGFLGGTYGLATGLDTDGTIQYADHVSVPALFNDGTAIGKTSYDAGKYSLNFNRVGDTYTLTSVEGTTLTGLEFFNHPTPGSGSNNGQPYTHIWTNNFWPMDQEKNTDPHTGYDSGGDGKRGTFVGKDGQSTYPPSDDGIAHNNMFGMMYCVDFDLDNDYSGPLEYLFFGDDDMWVFLTPLGEDGNPDYTSSKLVCDIGGVHSSVGEYVNLWDYISKNDPAAHGKYRLTFFYTERGLSGSTCYMQFTLPSVSSVTPEQNTSQLKVQKIVTGGTEDQNNADEFNFTIKLTDAEGKPLRDDYAYTRYNADGNEIEKDLITFDGGTFKLKNGEYIIIRYLPYGTKYTITENGTGDPNLPLDGKYTVSGTVKNGEDEKSFTGATATGNILQGENGEVIFYNKSNPKLPNTGGNGTYGYMFEGITLMTLPSIYFVRHRRKRS